ncbi:MAG: cupin domain-containing protein [Betaproteobacteria bacterium]|nr:cupin domain-containing protein [Betaproteobacteria bacterium]MBU6511744.1 cupin domain-containing protein [Betaproteobacteria bacterium]MDE1954237.1 cupin domain-containing protein [Betaproteobacteria bacterium]MDE2151684.1 cupin domain-containing protein [Betaproteobacteria bacterium]
MIMAIDHARSGEAVDVRPLGQGVQAERSKALFKARDLEVVRLVLRTGEQMAPHKVAGDITIHCLEGALKVTVDGAEQPMRAGQLMYLQGGCPHGLVATEDASALLTIALPR